MLKFFASAALVLALVSPAHADCDKAKAQEVLAEIESTLADRVNDPELMFVKYEWRGNWDALNKGQKRRMTHGIGVMEHCLSGKEVRIRYAGMDVGYFNAKGEVEIYD